MYLRISVLLIVLLASTTFCNSRAYGQWQHQTSASFETLNDIEFLNQDTGFIAGIYGIQRTHDGGLNWEMVYEDSVFVMSIQLLSDSLVIAMGNVVPSVMAVSLRSTDGGDSWTSTLLPLTDNLISLHFFNQELGFAVGSGGTALKTIDAGLNWTTMPTGSASLLSDIHFIDPMNGIIVGEGPGTPLILRTNDGGTSWIEIVSPATEFLRAVHFPTNTTGYIVGWDGGILKTTDGGLSWNLQTPASIYGNLDVHFLDENSGYLAGGTASSAGIQYTTDGGLSWYDQITPVDAKGLKAICFSSGNSGYAVGAMGTILQTAVDIGIEEVQNNLSFSIYPNPAIDLIQLNWTGLESSTVELTVFDLTGKAVLSMSGVTINTSVEVEHLASGTYIVQIALDGTVNRSKLIKR